MYYPVIYRKLIPRKPFLNYYFAFIHKQVNIKIKGASLSDKCVFFSLYCIILTESAIEICTET